MRKEIWFLILVLVIGIGIRLATMIFVSPLFKPVDVYIVDQQAPKVLLQLGNPYSYSYFVHDYRLNVFVYLPMVPLYYVPFYVLGNIKFGNIFADLLIMIAAYWIAKSIGRGIAIFASLTFAVLPASIWLTSVTATNIMIGTAFLMLSFAALVRNKYSLAAVFLGIVIASNQLVALMLPLFGYYFWGQHKFSRFLLSLAVSVAIILPFLIASPTNFLYGAFESPFLRPLQSDGPFSLYSVLRQTTGILLSTPVRVLIFTIPLVFAAFWSRRRLMLLILSSAVMLSLAAFILPVDGYWNYFLPSFAVWSGLCPAIIDEIDQRTQEVKWWPVSLKQLSGKIKDSIGQ
jgi:hypothetical protein